MAGDASKDKEPKQSILSLITVEPLAFAFTFGTFLSFPVTRALTYKKSCLVHFNETFCDWMDNKTFQKQHKSQQDTIQDEASYWTMLQQITVAAPCVLVVFFFMASWGDKVDRKIPIIMPLLGALFCNVVNFFSAYFMELDVGFLLVGTSLNGVMGTFSTFLMGIYTYIVYVASFQNKTVRVGIVEAMVFMAGGVSTFVSGLIRKEVGFVGVYIIVMSCQALAVLYCIFCLRSVKPAKTEDSAESRSSSVCCVGAVTDMIAFLKKKRQGKTTLYIWFYVVLINLMMLGTAGESDILYLFLRRAPRSFDGVQYGYFKGAESFSRSLALIVLLPFLKHVFQWRDTSTLIIGVVFKGIQFCILGFARTLPVVFIAPRSFDGVQYGYFKGAESFSRSLALIVLLPFLKHVFQWRDTSTLIIGVVFKGIQFCILGFARTLPVVFIALIFATLQGFPAASIRASMSKLVDQDENGRLFGIVAVTEAIISMAASFFFNGLYPKTFDFFDGILFECITGLSVIALIMTIYLRRQKADIIDSHLTKHTPDVDNGIDEKQDVYLTKL